MRRGLVASLAASVVLVLAGSGAGGTAQGHWVITDLGTLGGKGSNASAINERGQIVGSAETKTKGTSHAFLWQSGRMRDLGALFGDSWANAINDSGQVVGASGSKTNSAVGTRITHAILWRGGTMLDLTPTAKLKWFDCETGSGYSRGSCNASADAINRRGQVVVSMESNLGGNSNVLGAFLWQGGKLTAIPTLAAQKASGRAVNDLNDRGQLVGTSDTRVEYQFRAFVWQNGKLTNLGVLPGKHVSWGYAINESGQVVGESASTREELDSRCFLWQGGKQLTDLGLDVCEGTDINDSGQIVGWYETSPGAVTSGNAFLWQDGNVTDLGPIGVTDLDQNGGEYDVMINARGTVVFMRIERVDHNTTYAWQNGRLTKLPDLGGGVSYAAAINDRDQIVGSSTTKTGQAHAVLWTLKPGS